MVTFARNQARRSTKKAMDQTKGSEYFYFNEHVWRDFTKCLSSPSLHLFIGCVNLSVPDFKST